MKIRFYNAQIITMEETPSASIRENSVKKSLDSDFFTRLFVSERKQIALMADEKSHTRASRRLFATSRSEMEINMEV